MQRNMAFPNLRAAGSRREVAGHEAGHPGDTVRVQRPVHTGVLSVCTICSPPSLP